MIPNLTSFFVVHMSTSTRRMNQTVSILAMFMIMVLVTGQFNVSEARQSVNWPTGSEQLNTERSNSYLSGTDRIRTDRVMSSGLVLNREAWYNRVFKNQNPMEQKVPGSVSWGGYKKSPAIGNVESPSSHADDIRWDSRFEPVGLNGMVTRMVQYNGSVYAAGHFSGISSDPAAGGIARWNGTNWEPVGGGIRAARLYESQTGLSLTHISDMIVFDDKLFVAGSFDQIGGIPADGLAFWDGTSWHIPGNAGDYPGGSSFITFRVVNDQLYIGGAFGPVAGTTSRNIVMWDGSSFHSVGTGVDQGSRVPGGLVRRLEYLNGCLYVLGDFSLAGGSAANYAACFDGDNWNPLPGLFDSEIEHSAIFDGQLILAGSYYDPVDDETHYIVAWDEGLWRLIGGPNFRVTALAPIDDFLLVTGGFSMVARIDGSEFEAPGIALLQKDDQWNPSGITYEGNQINGALVLDDEDVMYVYGLYHSVAGVPSYNIHLATLSTGFFQTPVPVPGSLAPFLRSGVMFSDFATAGTNLFVTTEYYEIFGSEATSGLAVFNGTNWNANAIDGIFYPAGYRSLQFLGSRLYMAGEYRPEPSQAIEGILDWDGSEIRRLGNENRRFQTFTLHNDDVIAVETDRVFRLDGDTYVQMGGVFDGRVDLLFSVGGVLYATGNFTTVGITGVPGIAQWSGNGWLPAGSGIDGVINDMIEYNGRTIAAGNFTRAGSVQTPANLIEWDGSSWSVVAEFEIASGIADLLPPQLSAMVVHRNRLCVAGVFSRVDGVAAENVACLEDGQWYPLGSGAGPVLLNMAVAADWLYVSGSISYAGGALASGLAAFNLSGPLTSVGHEEREQAVSLELHGNYPNPFNPATNIAFTLREPADTRVEVFDLQGRLVTVLADGFLQGGRHVLRFDAAGLASGLYIYRVRSGGIIGTGKMMLIR